MPQTPLANMIILWTTLEKFSGSVHALKLDNCYSEE